MTVHRGDALPKKLRIGYPDRMGDLVLIATPPRTSEGKVIAGSGTAAAAAPRAARDAAKASAPATAARMSPLAAPDTERSER